MIVDKAEQPLSVNTIFPFSLLGDDDLRRILPFFEQVNYPAGAIVFSDGYPAKDLYFIISGKVKIFLHTKKQDQLLGELTAGDHFGEEALTPNTLHRSRAVCSTNVTVIRIKRSKVRVITDAYPQMHNAFDLIKKTFHAACVEKLPWREDHEAIELLCRRHPFLLFLRVFSVASISLIVFSFTLFAALASKNAATPLFILSFAILTIGCVICAWAALEWSNDYFILTQERVAVQKKLIGFYDSRHESPLNAILSVGIDTSFLGRLVGYGTITVKTYTGDLRFERLPSPYLIYELLESRRNYATNQARDEEKSEIRDALLRESNINLSRKTMSSKKHLPEKVQEIYQSNSLSDFLARFFNLRVQNEDSVVYRTHWWMLLRKTFLPGLFLAGIAFLVIARLIGFFNEIPDVAVYVGALIGALAGWGWWIYQYQDWQNDVYILTDDQLIDVYKKPLGNEDRRSAPVKNIQTVEFERKGLIGLLFNFGTVKIKIGNEELNFDNVYQPSVVQAEIYSRYKAFLENAKKNDQQRFVEWIKTYDEIKKEKENKNSHENGDEKG